MGAAGSCREEGLTLSRCPPGSRALGARLQAGRNHLVWGFHGKPISLAKSLLCGVNLSEVGFAAWQRASPNCQSPRGSLNPRLAPRVPSPRCRSLLIRPRTPQTAHRGIKRKPLSLQRSAVPALSPRSTLLHPRWASVLARAMGRFWDRASPCPCQASCKVHSLLVVRRVLLPAG